jgi:hypothetical protein
MDRDEFDSRFLRKCRIQWPDSFGSWLKKWPDAGDAKDGEPSRQDILGTWFRTLGYVEIDEAIGCLERMFAGDVAIPGGQYPRWSSLPAAVCNYCDTGRTYGTATKPKEDGSYNCERCHDGGLLVVWSQEAMHAAKYGDLDEFLRNAKHARKTVAVRCDCEKGRRMTSDIIDWKSYMCEVSGVWYSRESQDALRRHCQNLAIPGEEWKP